MMGLRLRARRRSGNPGDRSQGALVLENRMESERGAGDVEGVGGGRGGWSGADRSQTCLQGSGKSSNVRGHSPPLKDGGPIEARCRWPVRAGGAPSPPLKDGGPIEAIRIP